MAKNTYISSLQAAELETLLIAHAEACTVIRLKEAPKEVLLQDLPPCPPQIGKYINLIISNVRTRPNYSGYNDELLDDMISNAQFYILGSLRYYDPVKSGKTGAFGYISGNCIQSFNYTILTHKRDKETNPIDTDLAIIMDDESPVVKYIDYDLENIVVDSKYKKYLKSERLPQIPLHVEQRMSLQLNLSQTKVKAKKMGLSFEDYLIGIKNGTIRKSRSRFIEDEYKNTWGQYYDPVKTKTDEKSNKRFESRLAKRKQ